METYLAKGNKVATRDGKTTGLTTGAVGCCTMAGCTGLRLSTRWPDGSLTRPCTKGMSYTEKKGWRIL